MLSLCIDAHLLWHMCTSPKIRTYVGANLKLSDRNDNVRTFVHPPFAPYF